MWLNNQLLVFLLNCSMYLGDYLVSDVVDVGATFGSTYAVDETYLLELTVTQTSRNLPSLMLLLHNLRQLLIFLSFQI